MSGWAAPGWGGRGRRAATAVALVGLAGLTKMAAGWAERGGGLRWNGSASLPLGVYRLVVKAGAPQPGDVVMACPPLAFAEFARRRRYLPAGRCPGGVEPLGKVVMAVAGDRVEARAEGIEVNGTRLVGTGGADADGAGRPLVRQAGRWVVAWGEVWLISPHPRSLDSRYFGAVPVSAVVGRLSPVFTWGGVDLRRLSAAIRRAHRGRCAGGSGGGWRGRC